MSRVAMKITMKSLLLLLASLSFMYRKEPFHWLTFVGADKILGFSDQFKEQLRLIGEEKIRKTEIGLSIIECNLRCLGKEYCTATNFHFDVDERKSNCELLSAHGEDVFEPQKNVIYTKLTKSMVQSATEAENNNNETSFSINPTNTIEGNTNLTNETRSRNATILNSEMIVKNEIISSSSKFPRNDSSDATKVTLLHSMTINFNEMMISTTANNKTVLNSETSTYSKNIFHNTAATVNNTIFDSEAVNMNEIMFTISTIASGAAMTAVANANGTGIIVNNNITAQRNLTNITINVSEHDLINMTTQLNDRSNMNFINESFTINATSSANEINNGNNRTSIANSESINNETSIQIKTSFISESVTASNSIQINSEANIRDIRNETSIQNGINEIHPTISPVYTSQGIADTAIIADKSTSTLSRYIVNASPVVSCSVGYVLYTSANLCYRISTDEKTWSQSKLACETENALLANINTTETLVYLITLTTIKSLHSGMIQYANKGLFWSNGIQVTSSEKSNLQVDSTNCDADEICCGSLELSVNSYQFKLYENSCASTLTYICQKPVQINYL